MTTPLQNFPKAPLDPPKMFPTALQTNIISQLTDLYSGSAYPQSKRGLSPAQVSRDIFHGPKAHNNKNKLFLEL